MSDGLLVSDLSVFVDVRLYTVSSTDHHFKEHDGKTLVVLPPPRLPSVLG